MNENEQNVENPNVNSKNNKRYKHKNRRKKLADSLDTEGVKIMKMQIQQSPTK